MALDPVSAVAIVGAGIVGGFFNTLAGGGSLLTLPALMLAGLPADVANGSNRLAMVGQATFGAAAFAREGRLDRAVALEVLWPTVSGAAVGAVVASRVPEATLRVVLLIVLIGMATLLAWVPGAVTAEPDERPRRLGERPLGALALFGAGAYGGFVQAGVGFLLLAVLGGVLRHELVRANALKLVCTAVLSLVALGVFALADQVAWVPGLLLAAATTAGSRIGVRFATRVPAPVLRRILLVAVLASCGAALLDR